jgi:hypothetical protein
MSKITENNLGSSLRTKINRTGMLSDAIGGVDTFEHLPETNDVVLGTGITFIPDLTQIGNHDLVIVADANGDSHGTNAIYKASTTNTAGAVVTWTFMAGLSEPAIPIPAPVSALSSNMPAVLGTPPALAQNVKDAWDANNLSVEVYINGLREMGFTIDSDKKLQLTGYTMDGWTASDIVEVIAWL